MIGLRGLLDVSDEVQRLVGTAFRDRKICQALLAHDDGPRPGRLERMDQRTSGDLRVDDRRDHAQLGQTEPVDEELEPVLHGQRTDVAASQAAGMQGMGDLVRARIDLGIAEALVAIHQQRACPLAGRLFLDAVGERVTIGRLDPARSDRTDIQLGLGFVA